MNLSRNRGSWLESVPHGWAITRLMHVASINDDVLSESTESSLEIEYVDIGSVSLECGIERTERLSFMNAPSRARRLVRDGDILVSTVRTYLKAIAAIASAPKNLVVSTGFAVIRPSSRLVSAYAKYTLQATGFLEEIISRSTGVSYPAISASELVRICVPVPPRSEQAAIAAFLDREIAKIDALVSQQEALIALLAEKRWATIAHVVTRGLDADARIKATGIKWFGQIPTHWEVISLGRLAVDRCDGPFGSGIKSEHYRDDGAVVVRLQNIRAGKFMKGESVYLDKEYFLSELYGHNVVADDLLVAGLGDEVNLLGRACVAPEGLGLALVKADCFRFRIDTTRALPEFLAWQLSAGATHDAGTLATGTTRSRIPLSVMASRKVALPPMAEQVAIAHFVASENGRLDGLRAATDRATGLLKERRSALISAAVTGQINVRDAQDHLIGHEEITA